MRYMKSSPAYCVDRHQTLEISGSWHGGVIKYFEVRLSKCDQRTNPLCHSQEEVQAAFNAY